MAVRVVCTPLKGPWAGMVAVTKRVGSAATCILLDSARPSQRASPLSFEKDPGEGPSPPPRVLSNWGHSISTHYPLFKRRPLVSRGDRGIVPARPLLLLHLTKKPPERKPVAR